MSIESLTGLVEGGIGAIAVLGIFLTLIVSGKLRTEDSHKEVVASKDAIIADKDKQLEDKNKQISDLIVANQRNQERADAGVLAAQVTKELVQGIRKATS